MYKAPSRRRKSQPVQRLNLIPILDSVFIFIFFLLMSASFVNIFEISSDVPIISDQEPPPDLKPLALTLTVTAQNIQLFSGIPARLIRTFGKTDKKFYDMESLHNFLVDLKKGHKKEETIIFDTKIDLTYEDLVKIMDGVRMYRNTDEGLFIKDKDGIDVKVKNLFSNIVFANIRS